MWKKTAAVKPSSTPPAIAPESIESPKNLETTDVSAPLAPASAAILTLPETQASKEPSPSVSEHGTPPAPLRSALQTPSANGFSNVSSGLKIRGDFSGSSDLTIEGDMQGKIRLPDARVVVGAHGRVRADIDAREIVVDGDVSGNLRAADGVHFGTSSRFQGSVLAPRIGIEDGARFRGKVEMVKSGDALPDAAGLLPESESLRRSSARAGSQVSHS